MKSVKKWWFFAIFACLISGSVLWLLSTWWKPDRQALRVGTEPSSGNSITYVESDDRQPAPALSGGVEENEGMQSTDAAEPAIDNPLEATLGELDAVDVTALADRLRFAFGGDPGSRTQVALNEVQRMSIEVGDEGVQIRADGGELLGFELGAVTTRFDEAQTHATTDKGWLWIHTNQPDGLMQELIVPSRPGDAKTGVLVVELPVNLEGLRGSGGGQEIHFSNDQEQTVFRYREIRAWDAHGSELAASMAWNGESQTISWAIQDELATYPIRIDPLITRGHGELSAPGGMNFNQQFGYAVDVAGDLIAAGAPGSGYQGKVYLIRRDRARVSHWEGVEEIIAPDGFVGDRFGHRVRFLSSKLLLVSSQPPAGTLPSFYLFTRGGDWLDEWTFHQKLQIPSGTGTELGIGLVYDGEILAAGTESHEAFVWHRVGDQWVFGKRFAEGQAEGTRFGESIALVGDNLAIGAQRANPYASPLTGERGKVSIFRRNQGGANQWGLAQTINGEFGQENLGFRLANFGERLWIDVSGTPPGPRIFRLEISSGQWVFESNDPTALIPNFSGLPDSITPSARDIATSGNFFVQGLPQSPSQGLPVGRISIEESLRPNMAAVDIPTPVDTLSDPERYGGAIAIDQDIMVVGAPQSSLTVTNGGFAGRAYVFRKNPATSRFEFSQILTPNPYVTNGRFGSAVAVSGGIIAVGAPGPGSDRERAFCFDGRFQDSFRQVAVIPGLPGSGIGNSVAVHSDGWFAAAATGAAGGGIVRICHSEQGGFANWGFIGDLANPSTSNPADDNFGSSIAIDGGLMLVGAPNAEGVRLGSVVAGIDPVVANAGRAYLFSLNHPATPSAWTLVKTFPRPNSFGHFGTFNGRFGHRVALEGEIAAISEPGLSRVRVFDRSRRASTGAFSFTDWEPVAVVTSPQPFPGSRFGMDDIAVKGRRLAVGDSANGMIHLFAAHGVANDDWRQSLAVRPPLAASGTGFGSVFSLDYDGMRLAAGLPDLEGGQVLDFVRSADTFSPAVISQQSTMFAQQLALDGDELLVGTGLQGVLIRRNGGGNNSWADGVTLSPPDGFLGTGPGSVALARGRAFIAQPGRSGNSQIGSGRVNIFRKTALGYQHETKLEDPNTNQLIEYAGVIATDGLTLAVGQVNATNASIPGNQANAIIYRLHGQQANVWANIGSMPKSEGLAVSNGLVLGSQAQSVRYSFPDAGFTLESAGNVPNVTTRSFVAASKNFAIVAPQNGQASRFFKIRRPVTASSLFIGLELLGNSPPIGGDASSVTFDGEYLAAIYPTGLFVFRLNPSGSGWVTVLETDMITANENFDLVQKNLISLSQGRLAVIRQPQVNGGQPQILIFDLETRYRRWLATQFTAGELTNEALESTLWGDSATPGENGISNIARAYHGIDFPESNLAGLLPYTVKESGSGVLDVAWRRPVNTQGVDVEVWWSPDLVDWYLSGDGPSGDVRTLQRLTTADDERNVIERVRFLEQSAAGGFIRLGYFR